MTPPGVIVSTHEKITVDFIATKLHLDITFLLPSRQKGTKTPDIEMDGILWEIKGPKGRSSRTIENNLRVALQQSPNIILDLRRMDGRVPTSKYLLEVSRQFNLSRSIRRIIVITRQEEVIDFKR